MFSKPIEKYCRFRINKLGVVNAGGTAMILHCQKSPSLLRWRSFQPHNLFDHRPLVKVNVLISKFAHTLLNIYSTLLYTFYWCLDWMLKTTSNVTCQHVPRSKSGSGPSGLINWSRLDFTHTKRSNIGTFTIKKGPTILKRELQNPQRHFCTSSTTAHYPRGSSHIVLLQYWNTKPIFWVKMSGESMLPDGCQNYMSKDRSVAKFVT